MDKENKKYWLILEPYTFVFHGENGYILFNSLSNDFIEAKGIEIERILSLLEDPSNLYVIELESKEIFKTSQRIFFR